MHLDFVVEGISHEVEEFEKWWSTRVANLPIKKKDGKVIKQPIQIALRKRQAYTLIFPKEYLDTVINTLNPERCEVARVDGKGTKQFKTFLNLVRKGLRLKKIPKPKTNDKLPMINFKNVRVVGLGIRDDSTMKERNGDRHEAL